VKSEQKTRLAIVLCILSIFFVFIPSTQAETDSTDKIRITLSRLLYDRLTATSYFDATLTNISQNTLGAPIKVVIVSISDPRVNVANADGITTDGKPYFDYSGLLGDGNLDSQELSGAKTWRFSNPSILRFTYQVQVLAEEEPSDTTSPTLDIISPADGSTITDIRPAIRMNYTDDESGMDINTLTVLLNSVDISDQCTVSGQEIVCQPTDDLPEGENILVTGISDLAGNSTSTQSLFSVQYVLPVIAITNPVSGGTVANITPTITIQYSDEVSGIDQSTFSALINGADRTDLFNITDTGATCKFDEGLPAGANELQATISNNYGLANTATSSFTVVQSTSPTKYLFSLQNNPWIFSSPGDSTYNEFLSPSALGAESLDITSLAQDHSGNYYFTQPGISYISQSAGTGTSTYSFSYGNLGVYAHELDALHFDLDKNVYFSLGEVEGLFYSTGDSTNSLYMTNSELGAAGREVTALHIDYDDKVYFATSADDGILESTGEGSSSQFITSAALGVPGKQLDAFSLLPDTTPPTITITAPLDGAFLNTTTPAVSVSLSDDHAGIDTNSFILTINGVNFTSDCTIDQASATCQISSNLPVGSNSVVAMVSDKAGNTANDTVTFQIGILRAIPVATPTTGKAPLTVHFTTDGEDPAGTIEIFRWDFDGNGTWDTYDTVARDYNYTYSSPGTYTAILYVRSSTGESATASIVITSENNPPTATADVTPSNGQVPLTVQMTGTGTDPDGQIVRYEWDYEGDGVYDWSSTTTGNTTHTYAIPGEYQAVFRVTDNNGLTAKAVAAQTIVRAGPTGSPTATAAANPTSGNAPLTVNFTGTATDPDNAIVLYEWDFEGDGTYDWSSATSGTTSHTYTSAGTHEARFRATDATGLTGIDQVLVTVNIQTSLSVSRDTVGFLSGSTLLTATASSQYSSSYPPSMAIDGITSTYWISGYYQPANSWIEVLFDQPQIVNGVTITWYDTYNYKMTRARIDAYNDFGEIVYTGEADFSGSVSTVSMPNVENVVRIRLTTLNYQSSLYVVIREFQIDSTPMPNTDAEPITGTNINTSISAGTPVTILIKNREGNVVRTLVNNENRAMGSYSDYWDCRDNNGFVVNDGVYYAVMQYIVDGQVKILDLTLSTGGTQYLPSREAVPSTANTADPFNDQMLPINFTLTKASEVTLFVGILWTTNTRIRTIYNRVPLPAGNHTAWWDGLDDNENIAVTPPGNSLILGLWGYYLPNNAMYVTGGKPEMSNISAEPNYFSPFSEKCDNQGNGEGILLDYTVSENVAEIELRVYSLETNNLIRTAVQHNIPDGDNTFFWDGKNNAGEYADDGDYQVGLIARDTEGNESMLKYTLVRINY